MTNCCHIQIFHLRLHCASAPHSFVLHLRWPPSGSSLCSRRSTACLNPSIGSRRLGLQEYCALHSIRCSGSGHEISCSGSEPGMLRDSRRCRHHRSLLLSIFKSHLLLQCHSVALQQLDLAWDLAAADVHIQQARCSMEAFDQPRSTLDSLRLLCRRCQSQSFDDDRAAGADLAAAVRCIHAGAQPVPSARNSGPAKTASGPDLQPCGHIGAEHSTAG